MHIKSLLKKSEYNLIQYIYNLHLFLSHFYLDTNNFEHNLTFTYIIISVIYSLYRTDNWAFYQNYLSMALKFQQSMECLDFLNSIINISEKKNRAPYLARLELLKHTCTNKNLQCSLQSVNLMHQYFSQFGEKGCVVSDLRLYLNLLTPKEKLELLTKVSERET